MAVNILEEITRKTSNQRLEFQRITARPTEVDLRFCPWLILFKY
jgi:hypothetical protein